MELHPGDINHASFPDWSLEELIYAQSIIKRKIRDLMPKMDKGFRHGFEWSRE